MFLGGYEIGNDGLRVNIDENWQPTGDFVSADGTELSLDQLMSVDKWSYSVDDFVSWESDFLASGSTEDRDKYNSLAEEAEKLNSLRVLFLKLCLIILLLE